jgi:hypothetical protein
MRLPNGDRCGTPLRRFPVRKLLAVAGGVEGLKLCTTLLLSLRPLVLVDESSESDAAAPLCSFSFFLMAACFFRVRNSPEVPTICGASTGTLQCCYKSHIGNATAECGNRTHLAAEGTEAEGVQEAALADLAGVGDALAGPRLRALVQEHHARAVDDVGLHPRDVQHLLYLRHTDHVVVR